MHIETYFKLILLCIFLKSSRLCTKRQIDFFYFYFLTDYLFEEIIKRDKYYRGKSFYNVSILLIVTDFTLLSERRLFFATYMK